MVAVMLALIVHAETLTLTKGWQVQSSAKVMVGGDVLSTPAADVVGWYGASVPSTIMGVLTVAGVEPEALTAEDYQRIDKKRFDTSWWYRTAFNLKRTPEEYVLLSFDGICYRANIWLNGHLVAGRDEVAGSYRQFTFDVTRYVREQNVLAIEVFRAQPGEPNIGFVDWNPRPADESMGLFREVKVKVCGDVSVSHSSVRSRVNTETLQEAWLTIDTELTNHTEKTVNGVLRGTFDGRQITKSVTLAPHEHRMVTLATDALLERPRLWWCHTLGKPELYDLCMEFEQDGVLTDAEDVRFGVREIKSRLTPEGYRTFTLNGRDVLLRGAGWTDDIYLRDTPERNRQQLEYVCDMNMNTVRLEGFWGTSQSLYDLCDELGLLLLVGWSCHWEWEDYLGAPCDPQYGGITSKENIQLISESFADQVLWLRHHPSVIAWFVGSDRLPVPELEQRYRQFLVTCDDRPVVVSAKQLKSTVSGLSGSKMEGPYDYVSPAYWYDPQAPGSAYGFNTETGVGAQLPVRESLEKMLRGSSLWPVDERWNILCTASSSEMNTLAKLTKVMNARFVISKTIDEYLHHADFLSYESTKAMFEAFRVNVPRATGIIQWMLNSARPSIYWQLYDYYLQPNASYYAVKRANQPIQFIYDYQRHAVFAVNETMLPVTLNADMHLISGSTDRQYKTTLSLEPGSVVKAFDVSYVSDSFLFLKATDATGCEIAVNDYFLPAGCDEYNWEATNWVTTPISHYASYRALDNLPHVACLLTSKRKNDHCFELTLSNPSSDIVFFQRLLVKDAKGALICPAYWSDNYVTLAPGESRTITCLLPTIDNKADVYFEIEGF